MKSLEYTLTAAIDFYKRELTPEDYADAERESVEMTTPEDATREGLDYDELLHKNLAKLLLDKYKRKFK